MNDILIKKPISQETQYGIYTPIKYCKIDNSYRIRLSAYKSKVTGEETLEHVFCLNQYDTSKVQTERSKNDCHLCTIGVAHTINRCNS